MQSLLTGLSSNNGANSGGGFLGQIADARKEAAQAGAEQTQAEKKLQLAQEKLKELDKQFKTVEREAKDGARNLENMRAAVESLKRNLAGTGWSAEQEQAHDTALRDAKNEVRRLTEVRPKQIVTIKSNSSTTDSGLCQGPDGQLGLRLRIAVSEL